MCPSDLPNIQVTLTVSIIYLLVDTRIGPLLHFVIINSPQYRHHSWHGSCQIALCPHILQQDAADFAKPACKLDSRAKTHQAHYLH